MSNLEAKRFAGEKERTAGGIDRIASYHPDLMSHRERIPAAPVLDDDLAVHSEHDASPLRAACPRCGYRLDGEVVNWVERCPLHGICAECGDVLDWSQVLVPHKYEPRWSFEHAPRDRLVATFVSTTARLARPKRFLTELKMSDAVRPWRLAAYLGVVVAVLLLGLGAVQTVASAAHWSQMQSGRVTLTAYRAEWLDASGFDPRGMGGNRRFVRPEDFPTPWPIIIDGVRRPFAAHVRYTVMIQDERWYVDDIGAVDRLQLLMDRMPRAVGLGLTLGAGWSFLGLFLGVIATSVLSLSFVLLPWTRARCGVRWRHVVRIGLYAFPMPLIITIALTAFGIVGVLLIPGFISGGAFGSSLSTPWAIIYACAVPAYIFMWWGRAMSCHLRLPRPWFVAGMLMLLATLLVPFIAAGVTKLMVVLQ